LFACVDGSGKLDIWNISKDSENSLISINVDNGTKSLNRLKWSRNGTEIAVGDDNGKISIYEINESIALPNQNEFDLLLDSLKTLKQLEKEAKVFNKKEDFSFLVDSF
jgi:dynein intermediate chain